MPQSDGRTVPSILCEEPGCLDLARWLVAYEHDGEAIEAYSCDVHIAEQCNSRCENTVRVLHP